MIDQSKKMNPSGSGEIAGSNEDGKNDKYVMLQSKRLKGANINGSSIFHRIRRNFAVPVAIIMLCFMVSFILFRDILFENSKINQFLKQRSSKDIGDDIGDTGSSDIDISMYEYRSECEIDILVVGPSHSRLEIFYDYFTEIRMSGLQPPVRIVKGSSLSNAESDVKKEFVFTIRTHVCLDCYEEKRIPKEIFSDKCKQDYHRIIVVFLFRDPIMRHAEFLDKPYTIERNKTYHATANCTSSTFPSAYKVYDMIKPWTEKKLPIIVPKIVFWEDFLRNPYVMASSLIELSLLYQGYHPLSDKDLLLSLNILRLDKDIKERLAMYEEPYNLMDARKTCHERILKHPEVTFQSYSLIPYLYDREVANRRIPIELTRGNRNSITPLEWDATPSKPCQSNSICHERYLSFLEDDIYDPIKECSDNVISEEDLKTKHGFVMAITPAKPNDQITKKEEEAIMKELHESIKLSYPSGMPPKSVTEKLLKSLTEKMMKSKETKTREKVEKLIANACRASEYLNEFTKSRILVVVSYDLKPEFIEFLEAMIENENCGRAEIRKLEYPFKESDMPKEFHDMYAKAPNCCGWREYIRLSLWNLIEFERLIYMDVDAIFGIQSSLDLLFQCKADVLYTPGPFAALNAGMLILSPRKDVYNAMLKDLMRFDFLRETGWSGTGGGVHRHSIWGLMKEEYHNKYDKGNMIIRSTKMDDFDVRKNAIDLFEPQQISKKKPNVINSSRYHGIEGPQGFIHYFFVLKPVLARDANDPEVRAGKLMSCLYNYQGNCVYCREKYWRASSKSNNRTTIRKPLIFHKGIKVMKNTDILKASCYKFPKDEM